MDPWDHQAQGVGRREWEPKWELKGAAGTEPGCAGHGWMAQGAALGSSGKGTALQPVGAGLGREQRQHRCCNLVFDTFQHLNTPSY